MTPLILIPLVLTSQFYIIQGREPAQCNGKCGLFSDCPKLFALVIKDNKTAQEIQTIRRAHCGFDGQMPKVCCESEDLEETGNRCIDRNGQPGQCVSFNSCPEMVGSSDFAFVQDSRCQGQGSYSVCCPIAETKRMSAPLDKYGPVLTPCQSSVHPPTRDAQCCGIESSQKDRIIGGNETTIDQYPWLALIEYRGHDGQINLLCGAVLISGRYVLTAAHCINKTANIGTPVNIRLSEYDTKNEGKDCTPAFGGADDCTDGTTVIPIEKIIVHPEYDPMSILRRHDIALIRMAKLAAYTDFVRPICLPTADFTTIPSQQTSGLKLLVAGWGAVDEAGTKQSAIKRDLEVPYINMEECQPVYSVAERRVALWRGQICAGGVAGKDSCRGDSGGPLMYKNKDDDMFEVVGIVSFGASTCGGGGVPGIYTKVSEYSAWLRSEIKD